VQLTGINQPPIEELVTSFGPIPKLNDAVDVGLLHALDIGAVDFLVNQDQGIHGRARRSTPPLAHRVLTVVDAVAWGVFQPMISRGILAGAIIMAASGPASTQSTPSPQSTQEAVFHQSQTQSRLSAWRAKAAISREKHRFGRFSAILV
jgi:hypothetical protein